ncbi:kinase-like protein [Rhizophagus irregularis]|uniref:Kinase-like protein n=5 Tax=Rhizophagus irregularis TaxID=588596 RepID=A0A2N1MJN1_9GLOM|nr:Kin2p [Rhizophagus irregularis DAOM 197198w]PKC65073.1 kinase-like protein [Rhizophagus irregularis]PKK61847.1 kinase-like protein [Rhizophagus irregularis]
MKKSLCSLLRLIFKSIKKNKETGSPQCKGSNGKAEETKNTHDKKNQNLKKLFAPGTYSEKSVQDNKKKITNKYEEMIKNDKKLIAKPEGASIIKPMELRLKYGICLSCRKELDVGDWCKGCEAKKFEQNFKNWTSEHPKIDQLIQESQLNATNGLDYSEWIDYREIEGLEYITEGRLCKIFKGIWTKGPKHRMDPKSNKWINVPNVTVALKEMGKGMNLDQFLREVQNHQKFLRDHESHVLRCFGITKSPGDDIEITKWLKDKDSRYKPNPNSYIMVMAWANDGNLLNYIENKAHDEKFTWYKRLEMLEVLSDALERIHSKNMVHKNLHCGNVLMDNKDIFQFPAICGLALCNQTEIPVGVISFIAPEHLNGNLKFTTASDIYSFGIIMWVICCCKLPYKEYKHDSLAVIMNVVNSPKISKDIPTTYANLMKRCWDDDSKKRPKASELRNIFLEWKKHYHSNNSEFLIAEEARLNRIKNPDLFDDVLSL